MAPTSTSGWNNILDKLLSVRQQDNPKKDTYYYGVLTPTATFAQFCGGACIAGLSPQASANDVFSRGSVGLGFFPSGNTPGSPDTMAHEVGHAHGLPHAPCQTGDAGPFPYSGGIIGSYGYDIVAKGLLDPVKYKDMMGYCDPVWISDYNYNKLFSRITYVNSTADFIALDPDRAPGKFRSALIDETGAITWGHEYDMDTSPFGDKVKELNGGPNFVLGMEESPEYRAIQKQVMRAFRREDIAEIVAPMAAALASEIVTRAEGRLDAIEGLITLVATRICEDYYGIVLQPEQRVPFSQWTFAMSMYMFADPFDDPRARPPAVAGAEGLRAIVDASIAKARTSPSGDTIIGRLLAMPDGPDDETIRTYLVGMIAGFVPTNTMAAGNMLEIMLQRPAFLEKAQAAARSGDDDRLWRCLVEASRFKPINPGPFRLCGEDYVVAKGTARAKTIRKGEILLVSTWSAMFDDRRVADPRTFNPDRPRTDYMIFGHGLHWCLGALIAEAQITQTMKALLRRDDLGRADGEDGTLRHLGSFPQHLVVTFDRQKPAI